LCPIHPEKLMAVSYKEFIIDSWMGKEIRNNFDN
jgi:hypothetical protein